MDSDFGLFGVVGG